MIWGMSATRPTDHTAASLRTVRDLTRAELAAKADVDVRVVAKIETGESVSTRNLRKVAKALAVTPEVLFAASERARRAGRAA